MCISAKKEALKDEPGLRRVHAFSSFIQLLACVLAQLSPPPYNALVVAGHPLSPEHMDRPPPRTPAPQTRWPDRKSTRLNSSHSQISYAVFCLKKKKKPQEPRPRPQGGTSDHHSLQTLR